MNIEEAKEEIKKARKNLDQLIEEMEKNNG